jgi:hypothetical protein
VARAPRPLIRSPLALAALLGELVACEPKLKAGDVVCPNDTSAPPVPAWTDPIAVPWSSGFENQFCDYTQAAGYCYNDAQASFEIVTSPVHSGRYAAAFSVNAADEAALQARCVRQGGLPKAASYEAWYFVPASAAASGNWNLWYFEGGNDEDSQEPLWNVGLVSGANGALMLAVYSPLDGGQHYPMKRTVPIPIGSWFRIKFLLERATDDSGRVSLYQDDVLLFDETGIVTDGARPSLFGQWYVGNLAAIRSLMPSASTIYVDDVSVSAAR